MVVKNNRALFGSMAALLLPSAAILAALWLPFGFSMTGLIEEWDLLGLFVEHGLFFYVHPDGPLAAHGLRPLMPLSFALAHVLSPDSFDGSHWLTLAALLVKGGAMTYLTSRATGSRAWGIVAGALVLLHPADTMQLSFRSLHINVAIALSLTGCALLLKAYEARRRAHAFALAIAASLLYFVGITVYQLALTLSALPVAVLFVRHGLSRQTRLRADQVSMMGVWFASAGLYVGYALWLSFRISTYQGQVAGDTKSLWATVRQGLPQLFSVGGARALIGGWIDACRMVATEYSNVLYLGVAVCATTAAILCAMRFAGRQRAALRAEPTVSWAMSLRLVIAGVLLMLVGYAPFLTSPSHIAISQRTFLWATPGTVLVLVGFLVMLWRLARAPAVATMVTLLVLGMGAQLVQFHHYVDLSQRQRLLLKAIVEDFDAKTPGETLLVLDGSAQLGHTWMFSNESLHYVLSYLYGRPFGPFEVCGTPSMDWERVDAWGRKGKCVEDETGWTFSFLPDPDPKNPAAPDSSRRVTKDHATVVSIGANGMPIARRETADHRRQLQTGDETIDRRYRGILAPRSAALIGPMFHDQSVSKSYRWDFGKWWSMDVPPRGAGWLEAEWIGNGLSHYSAAWKMSPTADLRFEIAPDVESYGVRGKFDQFTSDKVRDSMSLRMNGQPLELRWVSSSSFEADVPAGRLLHGFNQMEFLSDPGDNKSGLAARLDWFSVAPL